VTCSILCVTDAYDLVSISIRPSSQGLESAGNVPVVPTGSDPLWAERTSVIRGRRNRNCGLSLRSRMPLQANAQFGKSAEKRASHGRGEGTFRSDGASSSGTDSRTCRDTPIRIGSVCHERSRLNSRPMTRKLSTGPREKSCGSSGTVILIRPLRFPCRLGLSSLETRFPSAFIHA